MFAASLPMASPAIIRSIASLAGINSSHGHRTPLPRGAHSPLTRHARRPRGDDSPPGQLSVGVRALSDETRRRVTASLRAADQNQAIADLAAMGRALAEAKARRV